MAESMKHKLAKRVVASWLKQIHYPTGAAVVLEEYPICLSNRNKLLGNLCVWDPVPSYDECNAKGLLPVMIFDVAALMHLTFTDYKNYKELPFEDVYDYDAPPSNSAYGRDSVKIYNRIPTGVTQSLHAFEVVHSHAITPSKKEYLKRLAQEDPSFRLYQMDADWVLSRPRRPDGVWGERIV